MTSNRTRIKYMTDGMLLREALISPLLERYRYKTVSGIGSNNHEREREPNAELFAVVASS